MEKGMRAPALEFRGVRPPGAHGRGRRKLSGVLSAAASVRWTHVRVEAMGAVSLVMTKRI